jgi:hypothetical protein
MRKNALMVVSLMAVMAFPTALPAQAQPTGGQGKPAPRRDLSGTWDAGQKGIQGPAPAGPGPSPFTPLGEQMARLYRPTRGPREVSPGLTNDPLEKCDPGGFPRSELFELRPLQIVQTPTQVLILYQFQRIWRVIWTDGRQLPRNVAEPRWYGYSVGKWADDTTFVVETVGLDERTWLDNNGNPHGADLRVEEKFRLLGYNALELTVTIDDPKIYTKPWIGVDKMILNRLPANYDIMEMICAPTEAERYRKEFEIPASSTASP